MPAATKPKEAVQKLATDALRHEEFCLPRPDADEPRVEGYIAYVDDPATSRSRAAKFVTRCLECGAQVVQDLRT